MPYIDRLPPKNHNFSLSFTLKTDDNYIPKSYEISDDSNIPKPYEITDINRIPKL